MIAEALRLLRIRRGLTQRAVSKLEGAPDFRTLSHWETRRKTPRYPLLRSYLESLGLDFRDLQGALEQVEGSAPRRLRQGLERVEHRLRQVEERLGLEAPAAETVQAGSPSPQPSPPGGEGASSLESSKTHLRSLP